MPIAIFQWPRMAHRKRPACLHLLFCFSLRLAPSTTTSQIRTKYLDLKISRQEYHEFAGYNKLF